MSKHEIAVLGGGCFWCTEAVCRDLRGVVRVVPGYAGGQTADPTYEQVCSGQTGHAEVVQIEYDPEQISYEQLLEIFFATHDPTTLNRQGADTGSQYRSIILYADEAQLEIARRVIQELEEKNLFADPVVTELVALDKFYEAEEYHHDYFARHPEQGYCQSIISPKLEKFKRKYFDFMKR